MNDRGAAVHDLRGSAARAVGFSGLARVGGTFIRQATLLALMVLLSPFEIGLIAMARTVTVLMLNFRDFGTVAAIIHLEKISERLLSSLFWFNAFVGIVGSVGLLLLAPLIAWSYDEPKLSPLLLALAPLLILATISTVHGALLRRRLQMERLAIVELAAASSSGVAAVGAALLGLGATSLVVQMLVGMTVSSAMTCALARWRPTSFLELDALRPIVSYSGNLAASNLLTYANGQVDKILISKFLGVIPVGMYWFAHMLLFQPVQMIAGLIGSVAFPVLATIKNEKERFKSVYIRFVGMIATVGFPVLCGIVLVSSDLVELIKPDYEPAVRVLAFLLPAGLLHLWASTVGLIYSSQGRTDVLLKVSSASTLVLMVGYVIGLQYGLEGVAIGHSSAMLLVCLPSLLIPYRLIDLRISRVLPFVLRPLACCLGMAAIVRIGQTLVASDLAGWPRLACAVLVGGLSYVALSFILNREMALEFLALVRQSLQRTGKKS